MFALTVRSLGAKCRPAMARSLFWEPHRKGGYDTRIEDDLSAVEHVREGFKQLKTEISLWKQEMRDKYQRDQMFYYQMGLIDYVFDFKDPEVLNNFVTTSDSDHSEGYSRCTLEVSPAGRALFSGYLDTRVPKDGRIKRAGYCNMRSKRCRKSFQRDSTYDWTMYNTFVMKVRGDGRPYLINLSLEGYWDLSWNDIYHYALYTRGGPYWQIAKIPFSKFIIASKGRVQDKQTRIRLDKVTHVGISCGEKTDGPFSLEIDYIGLEFDPEHEEEFAYEMYRTDRYISSA